MPLISTINIIWVSFSNTKKLQIKAQSSPDIVVFSEMLSSTCLSCDIVTSANVTL